MKNSSLIALIIAVVISTVQTVHADEIYFVHTDHINTPTLVTDQSKSVVWKADREPFGKTTEVVSTIDMPIRFPGQYFDKETGLHYNLMRDYDSRLGRYVQSDPLGILLDNVSPERQISFEMGVDLPEANLGYINHNYEYADQNPIMYIDPTGENTLAGAGYGFAIAGPPGAAIGAILGTGVAVGIHMACSNDGNDGNDGYTGHGENPEGQTGNGGNWDKHSGKRAGKRYGSGRNKNRGEKNKKYTKPKNSNKR